MSTLLKKLTEFFSTPDSLEAFISSKNPKTEAEVVYWTRWYEAHGICRGL